MTTSQDPRSLCHLRLRSSLKALETPTGFKRDGNQFHATDSPPLWEQVLSEPSGRISPTQATRVIQEVAEGNRSWFQDGRSKMVLGVLPRIFPEGTVILYELLQNAADSGASEAAFRLDSDTLLFSHNGYPFTENDVESISFVNFSRKPPGNIGFMGLGFKAAYEISDRAVGPLPSFLFSLRTATKKVVNFCPYPLTAPILRAGGTQPSLDSLSRSRPGTSSRREFERFDGRPLLYIGADLGRITTPRGDFRIRESQVVGQVRMLEVSESKTTSRTEYAVFSTEFELSDAASQEFASDRKLELSRFEGRRERVSIAISLDKGVPQTAGPGRLQVYLPTDVRLPLGFDVQGNFLVGASRKELRHASGPWNREHFRKLPILLADALEWAKAQAPNSTADWAPWYDLIPVLAGTRRTTRPICGQR